MKDIYELLNEIEIDESEFEEIETDELEKERIKKNINKNIKKKRRNYKKYIASAALIGAISIGSLITVKPAFAYNIPIIGEIIQKYIDNNENYAEYLSVIGTTKEKDGIEITFEEAAVDDNIMLLSFVVKNNNEKFNKNDFGSFTDAMLIPTYLNINGKSCNIGASGDFEFIDNNTLKVVKIIDISDEKLSKKMNVNIKIDELLGKKVNFDINFKLDKSRIIKNTYKKDIDKEFKISNYDVSVKNSVVSPLTTLVTGKIKDMGTIDSGAIQYIAIDNNNKVLKDNGTSIERSGFKSDYTFKNSFISNENMEKITFIPIYFNYENNIKETKIKSVNLDLNKNMNINTKDNLSLGIKKPIIDGEYLIINYDMFYKGLKSMILPNFDISLENNDLEIKSLESKNNKAIEELLKKYRDGSSNIRIFKVGNKRDFKINVYDNNNYEILEDNRFTVNLN